jgi:hypothetical protein
MFLLYSRRNFSSNQGDMNAARDGEKFDQDVPLSQQSCRKHGKRKGKIQCSIAEEKVHADDITASWIREMVDRVVPGLGMLVKYALMEEIKYPDNARI